MQYLLFIVLTIPLTLTACIKDEEAFPKHGKIIGPNITEGGCFGGWLISIGEENFHFVNILKGSGINLVKDTVRIRV